MERVNRLNIPGFKPLPLSQSPTKPVNPQAGTFRDILSHEIQSSNHVRFSSHAQKRMEVRNIQLNEDQLRRINEGVSQAESKGARESLLLLENLAFIVSIENRTVITALDGSAIKDNVYTNIDSAVIV